MIEKGEVESISPNSIEKQHKFLRKSLFQFICPLAEPLNRVKISPGLTVLLEAGRSIAGYVSDLR